MNEPSATAMLGRIEELFAREDEAANRRLAFALGQSKCRWCGGKLCERLLLRTPGVCGRKKCKRKEVSVMAEEAQGVVVWMTAAAVEDAIGFVPGNAMLDPKNPECIRSKLTARLERLYLAEDVERWKAKHAPPAPTVTSEEEVTRQAIFARLDANRHERNRALDEHRKRAATAQVGAP